MNKQDLEKLWKRGKDFLGTDYAIMGGAMSWVSEYNLVAAVSNCGAFGVLAGGAMPPELLRQQIVKTRENTDKPFGVNLIVMHPELDALVDLCVEEKVSHVVLAGGLPRANHIQKFSEAGIKTLAFAPNISIGERLIKNGIGALIIEGSEAGGHIGPVSTIILAQEILFHLHDRVPIFVAGGIATGSMMKFFLKQGASGIQIGTPLVCTTESIAHDNFKQAFVKAKSRDAQVTQQVDPDFPVIPVRAINNNGSKQFMNYQKEVVNAYKKGEITKAEAQFQIEHYWSGALKSAVIDGDVENGSLMAGQIVGFINDIQTTKQIIERYIEEALAD